MTLVMFGHFVNLAVNLVGFVAAIQLVRALASKRWMALLALNGIVLARRFFEITVGFGLIQEQLLLNVFLIPFLHGTLLDIATIGTLQAIRKGESSLFRLSAEAEKRYRRLVDTALQIEERIALEGGGGAAGGR